MATKSKDKTKISTKKPSGRVSEDVKEKILCEINSGMLNKNAASRIRVCPEILQDFGLRGVTVNEFVSFSNNQRASLHTLGK